MKKSKKTVLILSIILAIAAIASHEFGDDFAFSGILFVFSIVFFGEYRYAVKKIEDDTYTRWGYNTLLGFFKGDIPKYMVFSENAMLVCFIAGCGVLLKAIISYIMSFIL